ASDRAGVVDEYVETTELVERLLDESARRLPVGEVAANREAATPGAFDEFTRRVGRARVAVRDDVRAGLRESDRNGRAQARGRARHERHAVVEPELVENHFWVFLILDY